VVLIGVTVVVGLLVAAVFSVGNLISSMRDGATAAPTPASSDPVVAGAPLDCDDCFTAEQWRDTVPADDAYRVLGVDVVNDDTAFNTTVSAEQRRQSSFWHSDGGTPEACYVTYPDAPISEPVDTLPDGPAQTLHFDDSRTDSDEFSLVTHAVRVFPSSDAAAAHLETLRSALTGCTGYALDSGWEATVSPVEVPFGAGVDGAGWTEVGAGGIYRAYDLQYGNFVVRATLWTDEIGPDEIEWQTYLQRVAAELASLQPAG